MESVMLLSDLKRSLRGSRQVTGKVSFTTADGRLIEFTPVPRVPADPETLNVYARYAQRHIRAFLDDGMTAPAVMAAVAKKYRAARHNTAKR